MWKNIDEKIVSIKGYCLSSKFSQGKIYGQYQDVKTFGYIELEAESGIKGFGENYAAVYVTNLITPTIDFLEKYLIGKKLGDPKLFNEISSIPIIARNGYIKSVIGSIETAVWDLRGKLLNKPVYELLGKKNEKVLCYASGGSISMTPDEITKEVEDSISENFIGYKMRVGLQTWEQDLTRISKAKSKLIKKDLMIDAIMGTLNPGWDLDEAQRKINDLVEFTPKWIEEPLHPSKTKELKILKKNSKVAIAAGEAYSGILEFDNLIDNKLVDYLQFDCTHSGGISICKELSQKSKKNGIQNAIHVWGSPLALKSNLHLAHSIENISYFEIPKIKFEISDYIESNQIKISNGYACLDDSPGFGIEITDKVKEKFKFVKGSEFNIKRK